MDNNEPLVAPIVVNNVSKKSLIICVRFDNELLSRLDQYSNEHGKLGRSKAVRELISKGIELK
jgi:metal-responsive CopG/Arc/MetJ family transcriptional regulator